MPNTHGRPNSFDELQAWVGDALAPYIAGGGIPDVPLLAGLTLEVFGTHGYPPGPLGDLVYAAELSPVGPLSLGNGPYWVALHRDQSGVVAGWTRHPTTHYLWRQSAVHPGHPDGGLTVAQVTVASGAITAVQSLVPPGPRASVDLCSRYGTLNWAVEALGGTQTVATCTINAVLHVTADVTVPSTLRLQFLAGGRLEATSPVVVTMEGIWEAPRIQVIGPNVTVLFTTRFMPPTLFPEWWGAVGDGVTVDAPALQAALNQASIGVQPRGVTLELASKIYNLGTTSLLVKGQNTRIRGQGAEASILYYSGTDAAIKNDGTAIRSRVLMEAFQVDTRSTNTAKAIDVTCFSNSTFSRLLLVVKGTTTRGIYGTMRSDGVTVGSAPFYNIFQQVDIQMDNTVGGTTGSIGVYFQRVEHPSFPGLYYGPNSNLFIGGRITSGDTHVKVEAGNNNRFYGVESESARDEHIRIGMASEDFTGQCTAVGGANTLIDANATFLDAPASLAECVVKITGGTGDGQYRVISSRTQTTLTVKHNWQTKPDATSTYSVWITRASDNFFLHWRAEGDSPSTFVKIEPSSRGVIVGQAHVSTVSLDVFQYLWRWDEQLLPQRGNRPAIPYTFTYTDVAANLTDATIPIGGVGGPIAYLLPFDADIVAIDVTSSAQQTAGTLTVVPTVNGSAKTLSAFLNADVRQNNEQVQAVNEESMGGIQRRLGAQVTTSADWAPTTADISVTVWVHPT